MEARGTKPVYRDMLDVLLAFSKFEHAASCATDGPVQYSQGQMVALASQARAVIAKATWILIERDELEADANLAGSDLLAALRELTPPMPPVDAPCHAGIVPQAECANCSRIARAHAAIAKATGAA